MTDLREAPERPAVNPETLPAALLLTGSSDSLLEAEARRLAAILLCPGNDPERGCESCRRVLSAFHPDLLAIAPEGVQIRIDRIREALHFAAGRPYESARRVAVVSRAELLGAEAGNALLKSLEEPGSRFHWILTTTCPENLLSTIRSRCSVLRVPASSRTARAAAWRSRGSSEEDAEDLSLFAGEEEARALELLEGFRERRREILLALQEGLKRRRIAPLLLLSDSLGRAEPKEAATLAQLLADAAVAAEAPTAPLRHRAEAEAIRELASHATAKALARAALKAADAPPDSRRGNKRLHYEGTLLELYLAERPR